MACPYFYPVARLESQNGWSPARAPLGRLYCGTCEADPQASRTPDPETLQEACNFGYGRGRCPHFPAGASADAVRFSVSDRGGESPRVLYIFEKDHSPVRYGIWTCDMKGNRILDRQGRSFLETYTQWKNAQ
ncbi:MAG: hypothetical protein ACRD7E_00180 [Bryobacteraceae bacterium]